MIDRKELLRDLQDLLKRLEADLLDRSDSTEVPEVGQSLSAEYEKAKQAERTAQNYEDWRNDFITQVAAAWVLSCVFVRFLEDNQLIDPPKIAGPEDRLQRARDEHEIYFRKSPTETDREYLLAVFDELARLPGTRDVFGEHNPIHEQPRWLSGDAAGELLRFFRKIDANSGVLIHDFTDPQWDTRFLGDLYQKLSEAARKKYALLQTPEFVEEFILDRSLDPALEEFGLDAPAVTDQDGKPITEAGFRMIDPACGSGHFLLGALRRILGRWRKLEPGTNVRELVQRSLNSIHGVDINPFAIAIARFRLLLAALRASGVARLTDAPAFQMNLACGDSLYHGRQRQLSLGEDWTDESHFFQTEDVADLRRILKEGTFHCVVANPPYITPKDRAANQVYRKLYPKTCHMKYSLAVPFLERIFGFAVASGFTGQITANSFMKRDFGKKLIESFLPTVDLTHVVDTSLAYIPGHTTSTVILFGRGRPPVSQKLRAAMGIKGEPSQPEDPRTGVVWSAICDQIDRPNSESKYISVRDVDRNAFGRHPWSIGGGGAAELKEQLDTNCAMKLSDLVSVNGIFGMTNAGDLFLADKPSFQRRNVESEWVRQLQVGDEIREWTSTEGSYVAYPYDNSGELIDSIEHAVGIHRWLWPCRTVLGNRATFNRGTYFSEGLPWWKWHQIATNRLKSYPIIVFAFLTTHNHFILERSAAKVFDHSAPLLKLSSTDSDDDYLHLLGLLNSSVACFWIKQVMNCKGLGGQGGGIKPEEWHRAYEIAATKLNSLPIPKPDDRLVDITRRMVQLADTLCKNHPARILANAHHDLKAALASGQCRCEECFRQLAALQEEADWLVYEMYELASYEAAPGNDVIRGIHPEARPVECLLKEQHAEGSRTIFYDVHRYRGASASEELTASMKSTIANRRQIVEQNQPIRLLEVMNYKRRWQVEPWDSQVQRALKSWLLDRLESYFDFDGRMNDEGEAAARLDIALTSVARLADLARQDTEFLEVGEVYRDDAAFDVQRLVTELVGAEHVPVLPILRYKPPGLRKRVEWEKTWELQRAEDAIDERTKLSKDDPDYLTADRASDLKQREIGDIPVPPKYKSSDLISSGGAKYWKLRGKLDVPKERWVSFPHCEGEDGTLMIAWAGYDHLQQARAISAYYVDIQERLGGRDDPRLEPLLACLIELLPWLKQWHNEVDPEFNVSMGDYFEGFIQDEARQMDKTVEEIQNWQPPQRTTRRRKKAST